MAKKQCTADSPGYGDFEGDDGRWHCCKDHADRRVKCTERKCDYEYTEYGNDW